MVATHILSKIGVSALDSADHCVFVEVGLENNCTPILQTSMDGGVVSRPLEIEDRYSQGGVSVLRRRTHVRISVPNCGGEGGRRSLVMYVSCGRSFVSETQQPETVRFDVTRGINLSPTSHGLLGEFLFEWRLPALAVVGDFVRAGCQVCGMPIPTGVNWF